MICKYYLLLECVPDPDPYQKILISKLKRYPMPALELTTILRQVIALQKTRKGGEGVSKTKSKVFEMFDKACCIV